MDTPRKVKNLFRGCFNYAREVYVLYRFAYTKRQAWKVMCDELANKHGVRATYVYGLFDGQLPNYEITTELEIKEDEKEKAY